MAESISKDTLPLTGSKVRTDTQHETVLKNLLLNCTGFMDEDILGSHGWIAH